VQILDLHTPNPIVSYQNHIYTCRWAANIGTELLFAKAAAAEHAQHPALYATADFALLAASSVRLVSTPAQLVRKSAAGRAAGVRDSGEPAEQRGEAPGDGQLAEENFTEAPGQEDEEEETDVGEFDEEEDEEDGDEGDEEEDEEEVQEEEGEEEDEEPDNELSRDADEWQQEQPMLGQDGLDSEGLIPVGAEALPARHNQAHFLERLIALKRQRGEADEVTVYARKRMNNTGWRVQTRLEKELRQAEQQAQTPAQALEGEAEGVANLTEPPYQA
jgi:hypothetical protein